MMKAVFSEKYKGYEKEILEIINNFDTSGSLLSNGSRNIIRTVNLSNGEALSIKCFKKPNVINQFVYRFFRKSKAERSYIYGLYLQSRKLGTPAPVAYVEFPNTLSFNTSYYVCLHHEFDFMYRALVLESQRFDDWKNILQQFTRFTFKLHENNVEFLDHSPGNTLITKNGEDYEFSLVDLNRMNIKPLSLDQRIKNFAKLSHREDMMRIMSEEYALLMNVDVEDVYHKMIFYNKHFQYKWHRKERRKKAIKSWKRTLGL
jgi:hypothetical protein